MIQPSAIAQKCEDAASCARKSQAMQSYVSLTKAVQVTQSCAKITSSFFKAESHDCKYYIHVTTLHALLHLFQPFPVHFVLLFALRCCHGLCLTDAFAESIAHWPPNLKFYSACRNQLHSMVSDITKILACAARCIQWIEGVQDVPRCTHSSCVEKRSSDSWLAVRNNIVRCCVANLDSLPSLRSAGQQTQISSLMQLPRCGAPSGQLCPDVSGCWASGAQPSKEVWADFVRCLAATTCWNSHICSAWYFATTTAAHIVVRMCPAYVGFWVKAAQAMPLVWEVASTAGTIDWIHCELKVN
jgi:hypothetical protein